MFDRTRKPVKLRPHVQLQEIELRRNIASLKVLRSTLSDDREPMGDLVTFGCQHTIATTISARCIRDLTRQGEVKVQVRSSNRETCLALAALHYTLEGVGVGWIPKSIAAEHISQGSLRDLSEHLPVQELKIKMMRLPGDSPGFTDDVWSRIVDSTSPPES